MAKKIRLMETVLRDGQQSLIAYVYQQRYATNLLAYNGSSRLFCLGSMGRSNI